MHRSKALVVSFYVGALVIGGALGVAADRLVVGEWLDGRTRDVRASRDRLAAELKLTEAQRASLDAIFDGARRADSVLMAPIRPIRDSLWVEARSELRAMLTPEQQVIYDEMQARDRAAAARR
jgi:Spy/CpxP family protein refolding chaperone